MRWLALVALCACATPRPPGSAVSDLASLRVEVRAGPVRATGGAVSSLGSLSVPVR